MISNTNSPQCGDVSQATRPTLPVMLATWSFGAPAIASAWPNIDSAGGSSLSAVEAACRYAESDLKNQTVGVGGLPDRDGDVSLDAAIMLSPAKCGAVCAIRSFEHPISLARRVMEETPHTLLAGAGAETFATEQGFDRGELLTASARQQWQEWRMRRLQSGISNSAPTPNFEEHPVASKTDLNLMHDTIGVLALDLRGTLAAGCTTSGLPWKLPGRVGDSPILGHGIYVDPLVGACVCTGHGELVSGICGAFLAVECLRRGATAKDAAIDVIRRIEASYRLTDRDQVGVIVLDPRGRFGAASLRSGFRIAVQSTTLVQLIDPDFVLCS